MRLLPNIRVALALVALSAAGVAAQDPNPLAALVKLDQTSQFAVEAMIDSARAAGLPWRVLLGRAQEGLSKGASNKLIVNAVRQRLASLRDARAILGNVSDADLAAAAPLLEARVKPEQLAPFKNPPRGRSLISAFTALGGLVADGVPAEDASSAITKLWQDGAADPQFMGLYRDVKSDILQGLNPGAALQIRMRESLGGSKLPPPAAGEKDTQSP